MGFISMTAGRFFGLVAAVVFGLGVSTAQAALTGAYYGSADSEVALSLALQDDRIRGAFRDADGTAWILSGRRYGSSAYGTLTDYSGAAYFVLQERPEGLVFAFVPAGAGGQPNFVAARQIPLSKSGPDPITLLPAAPPPPAAGQTIDLLVFLESYPHWSKADAGRALGALRAPRLELLSIFSVLQTDLFVRGCESGVPAPPPIAERQALSCSQILDKVAAVEAAGQRPAFERAAGDDRAGLVRLLKCDRGLLPEASCKTAGVATAEALKNWQDAGAILDRYSGRAAPVAP
ncbi:MAG: hypothetical protein GC199_11245 [Alphaproteobacteria bacterium]|nr:hypothetical protein [Alphaproteobacteria bacterium]